MYEPQSPETLYQITVKGHARDQYVENVWYFLWQGWASGTSTYANYQSFIDDLIEGGLSPMSADIYSLFADQWSARFIDVKEVDMDGGGPGVNKWVFKNVGTVVLDSVWAGLVTGDLSPLFAAATIQLKTARPGREGRGSKRIGVLTDGMTTDNFLEDTFRTTLQGGVDDLPVDFITSFAGMDTPITGGLAVASLKSYANPAGPFAWLIEKMIVNSKLGSQVTRKQRADFH